MSGTHTKAHLYFDSFIFLLVVSLYMVLEIIIEVIKLINYIQLMEIFIAVQINFIKQSILLPNHDIFSSII